MRYFKALSKGPGTNKWSENISYDYWQSSHIVLCHVLYSHLKLTLLLGSRGKTKVLLRSLPGILFNISRDDALFPILI